jgi:phosphatidylserine decarboxylase
MSETPARGPHRFGRMAGYLPEKCDAIDKWMQEAKREVARARAAGANRSSSAVAALAVLVQRDGIVRMYVEEMIDQVSADHKIIENIEQLLDVLDHISRTAPPFNPDKDWRNFFPVSALFTYMMSTPAGEAAFRIEPFNAAIREVLREWCGFLDGAESRYVLNTGETGWLSPTAYAYGKLDQFVIPERSAAYWGWPSFNAYFHRQIKPECRPIDDPSNPKVIVSANDGTLYRIGRGVKASDRFWAKDQPYSLGDMLCNQYVDRFVGGDVFQSFLSGADYHRWHAPVAGVVRHAQVVEGLMFSDAESAGDDPTAGTYSLGYEASVNTRGLVFIESPDPAIGMICVIPIGIAEISSVTLDVKAGDTVGKGQELGRFSYGGSSMALLFRPGTIDRFTIPPPPPPTGNPNDGPALQVNARIAVAK